MKRQVRILFSVLMLLEPAAELQAGSYTGSTLPAYSPGIVVHSNHYTGTGGPISVSVCVALSAETYRPMVQQAIQKWNLLEPLPENCVGCFLVEDSSPTGPLSAETTILHEMGHCAYGISHVNLAEITSSFTVMRDWATVSAGADLVRGSKDDVVTPLPGARLLHWYRSSDNNPFTIDSTVIDQTTFTRQIIQLPAGHLWPASGNRAVAELFGLQNSQAVMYAYAVPGQRYSGLAADDVNTPKFAMTGIDQLAGTADDYTVVLELTSDCANADIVVSTAILGAGVLGVCSISLGFTGFTNHYRIQGQEFLRINVNQTWDVVFADSFETGDMSRWF